MSNLLTSLHILVGETRAEVRQLRRDFRAHMRSHKHQPKPYDPWPMIRIGIGLIVPTITILSHLQWDRIKEAAAVFLRP